MASAVASLSSTPAMGVKKVQKNVCVAAHLPASVRVRFHMCPHRHDNAVYIN